MKKYQMIPEGTKDVFKAELKKRRYCENLLKDLFTKNGYDEVVTPVFEYFDLFNSGIGKIPQYEMYLLTGGNGQLMVLRPDSTKPIARLVSTTLKGANLPLRLYYNQAVYKRNISLNRKADEIMQFGGELIGVNGIESDIEMIRLAVESLKNICDDFLIEIGHIDFFKSIIKEKSDDIEFCENLRELVFNKNYPALDSFSDKLSGEALNKLKLLPQLFGKEEILDKAGKIFNDTTSAEALDYLRRLYNKLKELDIAGHICIDLGIVNDYDYYTGIVFKGYIKQSGDAVLSGGRYDTLYNDFGLKLPAVGFALNVDDLANKIKIDN